jgi:lipid A 3-O-deacylase
MKKLITLLVVIAFVTSTNVLSAEKKTGFFKPWNHKNASKNASKSINLEKKKKRFFKPWNHKNNSKNNNILTSKKSEKSNQKRIANKTFHNISVYTGQFDINDEVGDDETSLIGIEHKNHNLFRDTWVGKFSPTTGAFVTGKDSIYLYTGVEADYNLGPISISPSFAPGYYEAGDGKKLGSALEFKSELKIGLDLFKDSNLGYSYSHISNNDWGDVNPGTDNQSITFSKKF